MQLATRQNSELRVDLAGARVVEPIKNSNRDNICNMNRLVMQRLAESANVDHGRLQLNVEQSRPKMLEN